MSVDVIESSFIFSIILTITGINVWLVTDLFRVLLDLNIKFKTLITFFLVIMLIITWIVNDEIIGSIWSRHSINLDLKGSAKAGFN